ncbi:hypothetical protein J3A83DRAFT_1071907 [Scleroderma citrinum]
MLVRQRAVIIRLDSMDPLTYYGKLTSSLCQRLWLVRFLPHLCPLFLWFVSLSSPISLEYLRTSHTSSVPSLKFIDAASGASISRRSLRTCALQLAHSLHNLPKPLRHPSSATARPTILVFSPNSIVWPIVLLGAAAAGFTVALANSAFTLAELENQYLDTGAHFIFVHPAVFDVSSWPHRVGSPTCLTLCPRTHPI